MVWCIFWMPCLFIWFDAKMWNVLWQRFKYGLSTCSEFHTFSYVCGWCYNVGQTKKCCGLRIHSKCSFLPRWFSCRMSMAQGNNHEMLWFWCSGIYFIDQCSSAWNKCYKSDAVSLEYKSDIVSIAKGILNVIEVLPRRSWWVEDDSLRIIRRFWACTSVSKRSLAPRAGTMEGIKGRYYYVMS